MEVMSIKSWPAFTLLPQSKVAGLDFQSICLSLDLIGQRVRRPSCHVVTGVKPLDGFHVIITQREVKEIDVLLHALNVGGLRDDDDPVLNKEPKCYLCGSLAVFLSDGDECLVLDNAVPALGQRAPCLQGHIIWLEVFHHLPLLIQHMRLALIDYGHHLCALRYQ